MSTEIPRSNPHYSPTPAPWVERFTPLIESGSRILDLACGHGRHARFFAAAGHRVLAVDRDETALATLTATPGIETMRADLEQRGWPFGTATFDAIVVTHYLHRPLFPHILAALDGQGVLIYETFAQGNEAYGRPTNPDFLLAPNELLDRCAVSLNVIAFEQGYLAQPFQCVVQRICAVGRGRPWPVPLQLPQPSRGPAEAR